MIAPALYLEFCQRFARFYARLLAKRIIHEKMQRQFELKSVTDSLNSINRFYYRRYLQLCSLQKHIGDVFNPSLPGV